MFPKNLWSQNECVIISVRPSNVAPLAIHSKKIDTGGIIINTKINKGTYLQGTLITVQRCMIYSFLSILKKTHKNQKGESFL